MQTPSASPKSLRQPSQLARGAPLSRGDLPHAGGELIRRRLPHARGSLWQCHAAAGSVQRDPGSFSLGKTLDATSKQVAAALEKGLLGGRAAIAGSAFLCARGRHEHILTAGFRRGKGHEKFES